MQSALVLQSPKFEGVPVLVLDPVIVPEDAVVIPVEAVVPVVVVVELASVVRVPVEPPVPEAEVLLPVAPPPPFTELVHAVERERIVRAVRRVQRCMGGSKEGVGWGSRITRFRKNRARAPARARCGQRERGCRFDEE